MNIEGLAAIVTGGASGLGRAAAGMLAERGVRVTILDRGQDEGAAFANSIGALFVHADVTDEAGVSAALDKAEMHHGVARILVNCAGIAPAARTVGKGDVPHALDLFRKVLDVNLAGTFNMVAKFSARVAAAEAIVGDERGVIVNTASIAAFDGQIGQAAYAASKGGIVAMTLPLARDLASLKIRVMTIAPGIFVTPMVEAFPEAVQNALSAQIPHPSRLGQPSEYARLVGAILENPMLNGEVIRLDGAVRMGPR